MSPKQLAASLLVSMAVCAAQSNLPELKVEAVDAGSVLRIRNTSSQPVVSYMIELVNYPGSWFAFWQDETTAEPIKPGEERRIPITNMTVGAAPEYVKMQAAVFADGSTAGTERVTVLVERRKQVLTTVKELIARLSKAETGGAAGATAAAELRKWDESVPGPTRSNRAKQEGILAAAVKGRIGSTVAALDKATVPEVLASLRADEKKLSGGR
ncbi:hypothetical protein [uncultured Paludibaculum sp.]|uniref:hypothetical protein n=1 Tax=uncultured Paludibaculum sp. TaxID=1765020 RepID=UPI002AAA832E|nr:hypothetical protein [uncultured Paludibaculum sp.]